MTRDESVALRALDRSLGECPRLAPSRKQVGETIRAALDVLIRRDVGLLAALYDSATHRTAHVHARRFLAVLSRRDDFVEWTLEAPWRTVAAMLRHALILLGCRKHAGGWRVTTRPASWPVVPLHLQEPPEPLPSNLEAHFRRNHSVRRRRLFYETFFPELAVKTPPRPRRRLA